MKAAPYRWRLFGLTGFVLLSFLGLGCRLVQLQWIRHDEFVALAENQHECWYYREAPRGDIRDRRGNLLATSIPVKTVCADPSLLKGREADMARLLAPLLKTNEAVLFQLLSHHYTTNKGVCVTNKDGKPREDRYVRLKHKVPVDDWEKIRASLVARYTNELAAAAAGHKLNDRKRTELAGAWLRSIKPEDDQIRTYPNGVLAAHVLGFVGTRETVTNGYTNSFTAGREGIEAKLDEKLRGTRGWVKTETDINKRELFMFRDQDVESRPGLNVVLTIDARIQQIVEEELAPLLVKHTPQAAFAMVVRPRTGEILALANLPTFDPNTPGRIRDMSWRRNRVITDPFEPGSTFKTITLAGAINDGVVKLSDMFDCENGLFHFAGKPLHDHEHYPVMSVRDIIAKSSNIGTAKVAIRMGQERAWRYITDFGFGARSGIPLSGEDSGYVPPLKYWKPIHISRIPIGQGVSATTLQTTMAMCAVANGGMLLKPMLVDSLVDEKGNTVYKYQPQPVRRVISSAAAKTTAEALRSVVEKGTAEKAGLENYTVAGKTGTAQKVVDGQYSHEKFFASFVGFFPVENPELCISVCIDEPLRKSGYYGGQIAAPVFKRIAERAANFLNIKPDVQPGSTGDVMASDKGLDRSAVTQVKR